jgi:hypothetical protein
MLMASGLQRLRLLAQRGHQIVEALEQLADLVVAGDRQRLQHTLFIRHVGKHLRHCVQRHELSPEHPPGQQSGQQGQEESRPKHALLHVTDGRKGLFGRQRRHHKPVRHGYALDRGQSLHAG